MIDEPQVPDNQDKPLEPQAPPAESGEANKNSQQISTLPDKFKGKSAEEIATSYLEIEKEIGRLRNQVGESEKTRQEVEQWRQLGQLIESDPVLFSALETKVKGPKQTNGESPKRDDTRAALEQTIVRDFERSRGLDSIEPEKRSQLNQKIGTELAEMLDPGGQKTYQEIIDSIPLDRLPKYLDKAYRLATADDTAERARMEGLISARQNNEASFGNIPASSGKSDGVQLTPEEKIAARRMNITEDQYAKNKAELEKNK